MSEIKLSELRPEFVYLKQKVASAFAGPQSYGLFSLVHLGATSLPRASSNRGITQGRSETRMGKFGFNDDQPNC